MTNLSRRALLSAAVRSVAGAAFGAVGWRAFVADAHAQDGRMPAPLRDVRDDNDLDLGDGFYVLRAGGANVLAVVDEEGVALVDGGPAAAEPELLRRVANLPGAGEIHTLFNTHWHPEQTGSNRALGEAGATIVSHVNTRLWLTTDVTWPWNGITVEPLPEAALPTRTFFSDDELTVAGRKVRCGYLRDCPHTDGDAYVFFPEQNIMAIGGAVDGARWPEIDWWTGGWIGGLVGGLDMLLSESNAATRFVPATGPVLSRAQLTEQYRMYNLIWERLLTVLYSGGGTQEAVAAEPTKEFNELMGEPEAFVIRAFESMWPYLSPDA